MNKYIALLLSSAFAPSTTNPSLDVGRATFTTAAATTRAQDMTAISTLGAMQNLRRADGPPTVDSLEPLTTVTPHPPAPPGRPPSLSDDVPRPTFSSSLFSMASPVVSSLKVSSGGGGGRDVGRSSGAFISTTAAFTSTTAAFPSTTAAFPSTTTSERVTSTKPVSSTRLMPPPPSTPSVVSVLWQPSSNAARSLSVPKVLLGFLSSRGVMAYNIVARDHPSSYYTSKPMLSLSFVSHTISSTTYPSTSLAHLAQICPETQIHCGINVGYDPKIDRCCSDRLHICALSESCAKRKASESEMVCGCAPSDAENATDLRILTTAVKTGTPAARGATTTRSAGVEPTRSAGNKLGVPIFVPHLGLLVRGAKSVAFLSAVRPECCGEICCKEGEVCTRSSDGAKCWPQAQRRDEDMVAEQETKRAIGEYDVLGEVASKEVEDNGDEGSLIGGDKKAEEVGEAAAVMIPPDDAMEAQAQAEADVETEQQDQPSQQHSPFSFSYSRPPSPISFSPPSMQQSTLKPSALHK